MTNDTQGTLPITRRVLEAHRKASKGRWSVDSFTDAGEGRSLGPEPAKHVRVSTPTWAGTKGNGFISNEQRDADARAVVECVNAAPTLATLLDEAVALLSEAQVCETVRFRGFGAPCRSCFDCRAKALLAKAREAR